MKKSVIVCLTFLAGGVFAMAQAPEAPATSAEAAAVLGASRAALGGG